MPLKIGITGINGRMGSETRILANMHPDLYEISALYSHKDGKNALQEACHLADVIIDFSSPENLEDLVESALIAGSKLVIGTTGLNDKHLELLMQASKKIAVIYAPNTSLGANLLAQMASNAAKILGEEFDIDIIDIHHKHKKDAPSGTALMIGQEIAKHSDRPNQFAINRLRNQDEIAISSIRTGAVFGEHEVVFASNNEMITIKHQALNRAIFAEGALKAARWLSMKGPGLYSIKDMLFG